MRVEKCLQEHPYSHFPEDQSHSVFWLVPLLLTFGRDLVQDAEDEKLHVELGLKMVTMTEQSKPTRDEIFSLVQEIYHELREEDEKYHQHLQLLAEDVHYVHQKDFEKEMLSLDDRDCGKILKALSKNAGAVSEELREVFADGGQVYVRQWLQAGFVNVLNRDCLLYVWDVLFLNDWSRGTLKIIVKAIIILLRFWMFRGKSYRVMRKTFLQEPFNIYLLDLKTAVKHLSNGGHTRDCPQSTNWRLKVVPPKPYWQEIEVRRDSLVKKIDKETVGGLGDFIGIIKSNFKRQESVSSVESIEKVDPEPWLELWQPYKDQEKSLPVKIPKLSGTFDLYIDGIRYLPQGISVAKINGNIFNLEMDFGGPRQFPTFPLDFDCCPKLNSFARFPSFNFKLPVNRERRMLNPNSILYLKIFGYEENSCRVVLVGTTLLSIFQQFKGSPLNYGGHQLQVRRGTPDLTQLEHLQMSDIEMLDRVPGLTVLVRLVTGEDGHQSAPCYESGYYRSHYCQPNSTDTLFYKSYFQAEGFHRRSVKKNVQSICNKNSGVDLNNFFKTHFSSLEENILLDPLRFHTYSDSVGLRLRLERMFGLASRWDSRYYQGLVEVLDLTRPHSPGQRFLTQNYLMSSQLRSPEWQDESHLMTVTQSDHMIALGQSQFSWFQSPVSLYFQFGSTASGLSMSPAGRRSRRVGWEVVLMWISTVRRVGLSVRSSLTATAGPATITSLSSKVTYHTRFSPASGSKAVRPTLSGYF